MTPTPICRYKYVSKLQYSAGEDGIDGNSGSRGTNGTLINSDEINW